MNRPVPLPRSAARAVAEHRLDAGRGPEDTHERASDPGHLVDPERTVRLFGRRLAEVHEIAAPVDPTSPVLDVEQILSDARRSVATRLLDGSTQLSPPYRHLSVERLLEVLEDGAADLDARPAVLTHGQPSLALVRCEQGRALGFVDWSAAAWSDPHRDLAVAARDVATSCAPILVPTLFGEYDSARTGWEGADPIRLDWYALASELGGC